MRNLRPTLLIEPNSFFRQGLEHILSQTRFRCCHAASSIESVPGKVLPRAALCILGTGEDWTPLLDAVPRIRAVNPSLPVVGLCRGYDDDDKLTAAVEGGISGLLTKDVSSEALVHFLELIALGERIVPIVLLKKLLTHKPTAPIIPKLPVPDGSPVASNGSSEHAAHCLSNREEAILRHLIGGASNKTIARWLRVSDETVKVHIKAILRKIRVQNRTQAAIWAMQNLRHNGGTHRTAECELNGPGTSAEWHASSTKPMSAPS